jgi:uncharacterized protein YkwD
MPSRSTAATTVAVLVAATVAASAPAATPTRSERAVLAVVNETRAARDLPRVRFGWPLQRRTHAYARYLLRTGTFGHADLAPGTRENLAWGPAAALTARRVVRLWLRSPGHRATLLWRGARRAGVGVARGPYRGEPDARVVVLRLR